MQTSEGPPVHHTQPPEPSVATLPAGTVTFLFTDIEGSTQLLERLRDEYAALLAQHHRLLREVFARYHGREVDTQGDAFFVAFPRATDAVGAVVDAQRSLANHAWPRDAAVRVRMGLHTGEPWVIAEGYVGMSVHRAARIAHAGHGGQVLLSETTASLVQDELPEGVALLDLGRHQLKDMRRPEHIQQLVIEGLPAEFPPLSSLVALPPAQPKAPGANGVRVPREVGPSPYQGLAAFRQADAHFFFGREAFTGQLADTVQQQALVAVIVGPSGSGKSSVVFAGLLPKLSQKDGWLALTLRPGTRPFHALAGALQPHLEEGLSETDRLIEVEKLARALAAGELPLYHVVERILERHPETRRLLLVVDQFEELFTQRPDPDDQRQFLDELLAATEVGASPWSNPLTVLLTLRADFMGQALAHRPFADALQEGSLLLGPMNREELQAAVEKPAELQGAAFETGLVARILDDVGEEPGNLPLLEFALSLLWERMDQGWLTHEAYEEIGTVDGALARYAEEAYGALPEAQAAAARRVFVQLVQPGEGTEDTRRVAGRSELGDQNWPLVQHLADRRLVVTGRDEAGQETVEVVHEALIRNWERLRGWIEADRAFRVWQEGLRATMRQWQASDHDEGALLRGAPLATAEVWLAERGAELSPAEQGFIEASGDLRARERARRERRRRWTIASLAGGLAVALFLLGVALLQSNLANQRARVAFSRELAAASVEALAEDQELAVLLAVQALEQDRTQEAEEALHRTAQDLRLVHTLRAPGKSIWIDLSPNDQLLVTSGETGAIVWDANTGEMLYDLDVGHWINQAAFSPDGSLLVLPNENTTSDNPDGYLEPGTVTILQAETGEELLTFVAHEAWVQDVTFSPDGALFATASGDGTAKVWDLAATLASGEGQERLAVTVEDTFPGAVEFSPDGRKLATCLDSDLLYVWDANTGQELWNTDADQCAVTFSPDGTRLVVNSRPGILDVLDSSSGQRLSRARGLAPLLQSAKFSRDGNWLASTGNDDKVQVWSFSEDTLSSLFALTGHKGQTVGLDLSSDGERLVSGSADDTVRIWDISPDGSVEPVLYPHLESVQSVSFSPDGSRLVTGGVDGIVKIWDALSGEELQKLTGSAWIWRVTYSPDGALLAVAERDATVRLWDVATGEELSTIGGLPQQEEEFFRGVLAVAFSPDGERLATAGGDGSVRLWDVAALRQGDQGPGDELLTLEDGDELHLARDVSFSPDGRWIAAAINTYDSTGVGWFAARVVKVWDATTGQELWTIGNGSEGSYSSVSFSLDGKWLAAGTIEPGMSTVWRLPDDSAGTPEELSSAQVGSQFVAKLNFSPDGAQLAVPHTNGLGIWDAGSDELLKSFPHPGAAFEAVYSPDGKRLAVAGSDGMGRLFFLDPEELVAQVQSRLTRSLTTEECRKYLHMEECPEES